MSATANSPDGLYTVEEMRASYPYCPVCECVTIPLRDGACAWCDTLIAPKQEETEQRARAAERHRVYQLDHKDQINKRRRELRRERQDHVRRYRRLSDALPDDSRLTAAQVMPSGEVTEGDHGSPGTELSRLGHCQLAAPSVTSSLCATQPEPPYPNPERENGAVRAGLAEATNGEIAKLAPAPQLYDDSLEAA